MEHRNWAVQTGRLQSHNFLAFMSTGRILGRICASRRKTDQISHEMLIAQNNYYLCSPANYNWKQFRHLLFSIMLFIYLFIYLPAVTINITFLQGQGESVPFFLSRIQQSSKVIFYCQEELILPAPLECWHWVLFCF